MHMWLMAVLSLLLCIFCVLRLNVADVYGASFLNLRSLEVVRKIKFYSKVTHMAFDSPLVLQIKGKKRIFRLLHWL